MEQNRTNPMKPRHSPVARWASMVLAGGLTAGLTVLSAPSFAQVSFDLHVGDPAPVVVEQPAQPVIVEPTQAPEAIGIEAAPPPAPIVEEVQPTIVEAPAPNVIWVPGYYDFDEHVHRYHWVEGAWQHRPHDDAEWIAPRYDGGRYFTGHWGGHAEAERFANRTTVQSAPQAQYQAYGNRSYENSAYSSRNQGYMNRMPQQSQMATTTTTTTASRGFGNPNSYRNHSYANGYNSHSTTVANSYTNSPMFGANSYNRNGAMAQRGGATNIATSRSYTSTSRSNMHAPPVARGNQFGYGTAMGQRPMTVQRGYGTPQAYARGTQNTATTAPSSRAGSVQNAPRSYGRGAY